MFGEVASDAIGASIAVFACGGTIGNGGKTADLVAVNARKQCVLLDLRDEICENDVKHVL